jgi:hypothetical protein
MSRFGLRTFRGNISSNITSAFFDVDLEAFLVATGITDATTVNALSTLISSLKSNNFWNKFQAIYPMVGGTSTTCKFNLKDPRDANDAYRLTFSGGWTFASTGATPNASNAYADTYLAGTATALNDVHISYYSRTSNTGNFYCEMGISETDKCLFIIPNYSSTLGAFRGVNSRQTTSGESPSGTRQTSTGLFIANRIASGTMKLFRNGTPVITDNIASNSRSSVNIYLGANNNSTNVPANYTNRQCAFASIGEGFSDTDASTFYTIVQTFNTSLSRQV